MNWLKRWSTRREDHDVAEEVTSYLDDRVEELIARGMPESEARRQACLELGNTTAIREQIYQANGVFLLETLWQDLRYAIRGLARRPGFALGVALTLGLGIGAATTAFTAVDQVIFRALPYKDPSTLVAVGWIDRGAEWVKGASNVQNLIPLWDPTFLQLRERARSLNEVAALSLDEFDVASANGLLPERIRTGGVTPGFLEMLNAKPALGRTFVMDDYQSPARVAIISYGSWQRRFGGSPDVVGRAVQGTAGPLTVVGVLPADFQPPEAFFPVAETPELWVPMRVAAEGEVRRVRNLMVIGRLSPTSSLKQARSELERMASDLAREFPQHNVQRGIARRIGVNDLQAQTIGNAANALSLFMAAATLLLILGMINAGTLLLARSLDRMKEFALRMALGAGRMRLVRLLIAETVALSLAGGAIGGLLSYGGVALLTRYAPMRIPRLDSVGIDTRVWLVVAATSLGVGVMMGLLPAFRLGMRGASERLRDTSRTVIGSAGDSLSRLRTILVGGQVAVAVVLLCATGLLLRSFIQLQKADLGFEGRGLVKMGVEIKGSRAWNFQSHWSSWDALLDDLRAVPRVQMVALTSNVPFQSPKWTPRILLADDPADAVRANISGYAITPGYLNLVGTAIRSGRDFGSQDGPASERVAIVNESFVRTILNRNNAVGSTIYWSAGTEWTAGDEWKAPAEWLAGEPTPLRIVGVVEDVVQLRLGESPRPAIYVPYTQSRPISPTAVIRATVPIAAFEPGLRAAVARFNPRLSAPVDLSPMVLSERTILQFQVILIAVFAGLAVLLAASGLYGSMLHFVALRRREFGVRMALGSTRFQVFAFVLREGAIVSITGLVVGIVSILLTGRLLSDFLFGVSPNDVMTLTAASALLIVVSATACLVPAQRATSVDPSSVLKEDT